MSKDAKKVIAKITNLEEFSEVCGQLKSETMNINDKNELFIKIEDFIRRSIENYHTDKNE